MLRKFPSNVSHRLLRIFRRNPLYVVLAIIPSIIFLCVLGSPVRQVHAQHRFPLPNGHHLRHSVLTDGLMHPTRLAIDSQGALWIACALDGRVLRRTPDGILAHITTVLLDAPDASGSRGQLSGIALREYAHSTSLFLAYTSRNNALHVIRIDITDGRVGPPVPILEVDRVPSNRRIGLLTLRDGTLLVTVPSFDSPTPLAPATTSGRVFRIYDDGTAAADNPFANPTTSATPLAYVYTTGHRNICGLTSVDGSLATVYAVEAGAVTADEVNRLTSGKNYGWSRFQGFCSTSTEDNSCPEFTFSRLPSDVTWYGSSAIPDLTNSLLVATRANPALLVARISPNGSVIDHNPMADPSSTFHSESWREFRFERDGAPEHVTCVGVFPDGSIAVGTELPDGLGRIHHLAPPTAVAALPASNEVHFSVAPCPASSVLTFVCHGTMTSNHEIIITDLAGRLHIAHPWNVGMPQRTIQVHTLASGTYIARIGTWTSIIVILHS